MQSTTLKPPPQTTAEFLPLRESHWWTWAIRGVLAIVLGIMAFVWPGATISSLIWVFGFYAIVDGSLALIEAIKRRKTDSRWWALLLEGIVGLVLGASALLIPGLALITFIYLLGVWAIATGAFEIVQAFRKRNEIAGEGWLIAGGILSVIFGIAIILQPESGAFTLIWLLSGYAIAFGVVMLIMAFKLRRII